MTKVRKVISVVGARPNFIKIAPVHNAFRPFGDRVRHLICHTGQHFDKNMSDVFFKELEMPTPDYNLGVSGGSHAVQTARIMIEFEKVLETEKPDLVIVPGDVNSTLAASLVAAKLSIPVAHVESGLRSFDRAMPEEINRILTDIIADMLFVSEPSGIKNLRHEGIDEGHIFYTGNVMIDSLVQYLPLINKVSVAGSFRTEPGNYTLVTLHRPTNVDNTEKLADYLNMLNRIAEIQPVIFPVHPRTRANIEKFGLQQKLNPSLHIIDPAGYIDFIALIKNASLIITDSGGIQEESTFLGVQCITCRENTERPVTVEIGTNHLVGTDISAIFKKTTEILGGKIKKGRIPDLWDGKTAERIAGVILKRLT
jgi:UDP-N-acetylglucosamine 2-epimerase (non-hydrolysing)